MQNRHTIPLAMLVKSALFLALLCVASFLVIPVPISPSVFSLHTLLVVTIGLYFPLRYGIYTISTYILMGIVGLPVLAGGSGGIGKIFGPTGGFYIGFFLAILLLGFCKGKTPCFWKNLLLSFGALLLWHACGIWFACLFGKLSVAAAFLSVSLPFLLGDILKCIVGASLSVSLQKHIPI